MGSFSFRGEFRAYKDVMQPRAQTSWIWLYFVMVPEAIHLNTLTTHKTLESNVYFWRLG